MEIKEEIERIKTLLGLHYFIHERIYQKTIQGYIKIDEALIVLRRNHNIPKEECPIIFKGLEILGLVIKEKDYFKVKKPSKSKEELVLDYKKKLKLI
jgi:hypothetical protein